MIPRSASVLLLAGFATCALWAQAPAKTPAPPEVDQALRARVSEFFQYHVDRGPGLRKAMDLVAEDTKDYYFQAQKMEVKKFNITGIQYADGFNDATVTLDVTRNWIFGTFVEEVTLPMDTRWRVEDNHWVWYKDNSTVAMTPMGVSNTTTMAAHGGAGAALSEEQIKELADPKKLLEQAQKILGKSELDRNQVHFTAGQAGEQTVVFHNGYLGAVILELQDLPEKISGLSVSLSKNALNAQEEGQVVIRYTPPAPDEKASAEESKPAIYSKNIRLIVQPFNRELSIGIEIERPPAPVQDEAADKEQQQ